MNHTMPERESDVCELIATLASGISGQSRIAIALSIIRSESKNCEEPEWKAALGTALAKFHADYGSKAPDDLVLAAAMWTGAEHIEESVAFILFLRDKGYRINPILQAIKEKVRDSAVS